MTTTPERRSFDPNFDMRMKYNEGLGMTMQLIAQARALGQHDTARQLIRSLLDFVNPYLSKKEIEGIDKELDGAKNAQVAIMNFNVRDRRIMAERARKMMEIEDHVSNATRLLFDAMGKHSLLLPLKVEVKDFDSDERKKEFGL